MDTAENPEQKPARQRPFLQFSLRALLLLIAVCAVSLGLAFHRAREQARAVAAIRNAGGSVWYDFQEGPDVYSPNVTGTSNVPSWLVDQFGVDLFHNVIAVSLSDSPTDDALEALDSLPKTQFLSLFAPVKGKAIAHLSRLTELRLLAVWTWDITDDELSELTALRSLEDLRIFYWFNPSFDLPDDIFRQAGTNGSRNPRHPDPGNISDHGLLHLKDLQKLRYLRLDNTNVTREGAAALSEALPHCAINVHRWARAVFYIAPHGPPPGW
jgi:hypothetical protein